MPSPRNAPLAHMGFESLTRSLVDSPRPKHHCPECDSEINFGEELEWMGPTAFRCKNCKRVIEIHRIDTF